MRTTDRCVLGTVIWLAFLAAGASGGAGAAILGSKHDLSNGGGAEAACVYCHTPPKPDSHGLPTWTRAFNPPGAYRMYTSDSMDMAMASGPQGVSLLCLSCHDGTIAIDNLTGRYGGMRYLTGSANLGLDLSDDHPISLTYDPSRDPGRFAPPALVEQAGLRLYGPRHNQVECGTCHDSHKAENRAFLRISNARSAMCLACHLQ